MSKIFIAHTSDNVTRDEASSSAIIVKEAILARSGVYHYSHAEMLRRGITPAVTKDFYSEYRPASVLVNCKDKFKYAVLTKEHPPSISTGDVNKVLEGVVGSGVEVVTLDNGEIALKGEIAFYTRDSVDYYNAGAKETSAQYISQVVPAQEGSDYDFILEDIREVQALALTRQGRGGSSVAVLDSIITAGKKAEQNTKSIGDNTMNKKSILSFLGIGKVPQDVLPSLVIDSLDGYEGLSDAEKQTRKAKVDKIISSIADSKAKDVLSSTVADCFNYPKEVVEQKDKVSASIKALCVSCVGDSHDELKKTFDAIMTEDGKGADDESKKSESKDKKEDDSEDDKGDDKGKDEGKNTSDSILTEDAISQIVAKVTDSVAKQITDVKDGMETAIDKAVKKNLGLDSGDDGQQTSDSILPAFANKSGGGDNSFLTEGMFKG